ncbi:hypothetical protein SKAU_G00014130 [Synaphobranchus kaupii]|uniref:Uncharacterized protein n=1 Tax=Synaphobranchus kaupii TaxID=118154 RepID=A0A9Q1GBQ2_SYNKA|nr:hypothetical protein SKAU_G00014130 [Synaphobranchus kaupii]
MPSTRRLGSHVTLWVSGVFRRGVLPSLLTSYRQPAASSPDAAAESPGSFGIRTDRNLASIIREEVAARPRAKEPSALQTPPPLPTRGGLEADETAPRCLLPQRSASGVDRLEQEPVWHKLDLALVKLDRFSIPAIISVAYDMLNDGTLTSHSNDGVQGS